MIVIKKYFDLNGNSDALKMLTGFVFRSRFLLQVLLPPDVKNDHSQRILKLCFRCTVF